MSNKKKQILEVAAELLQTRVFSAFSYRDISDRLGISNAAIHNHYRTKEDLGNALLDNYIDATKMVQLQAENADSHAWGKFDAYINEMAKRSLGSGQVCLASVLRLEHNIIPDSMQHKVAEVYELDKVWLEKILKSGIDTGEMHFEGSPKEQASLIIILIQGALINARAEGDKAFYDAIRQIKINMLQA